MKHPNEMQLNLDMFHSICEAYEVLSNRKLQQLTDKARLKIVYD